MEQLTDQDSGSYMVRTSSGTVYLIDLDRRLVQRLAAEYEPSGPYAKIPVAVLRRDADPIPLLKLERLQVGERGMLILDLRGDGILTFRDTTEVRTITSLEDEPSDARTDRHRS
jgi:hypothetical protein